MVAVEKGVVDGASIREKDNPKGSVLKCWNPCPSPDSAIALDLLTLGMGNHLLNPFIQDHAAVGTCTSMPEILGFKEPRHGG